MVSARNARSDSTQSVVGYLAVILTLFLSVALVDLGRTAVVFAHARVPVIPPMEVDDSSDGADWFWFHPEKGSAWERPRVDDEADDMSEEVGWVKKDAKRYFWHNLLTDETTWDIPNGARVPSEHHPGRFYYVVDGKATWFAPHDSSWRSVVDPESGHEFYVHKETDEISWEPPEELAWVTVYVDYDDASEE